jgi:N6-adenosine-specific RNA methylase IME4
MATELLRYNAARKALSEASRVDEVKNIRDKAIAMQVYAKQAKDGDLIGMATEIRKRAERRLGEIMEVDRRAGKLKRGGDRKSKVSEKPLKLEAQGIDKNLADRARKAAAMPEAKYEAEVAKSVKIAVAAAEGHAAVIKEARAERHEKKKAQRAKREKKLGSIISALPKKKYGVILADPEWRFEFWSAKGKTNSSADNHYPTSALEEIKKRDIPSISANDCVLFLWATVPMLPHALEVLDAWGFRYVSHFCWVKSKAGTGYWNRNKHELLLIGTHGKVPAPADGMQYVSAIEAPVRNHSEKPDRFLEMIEHYYPTLPKIELNARKARKGWDRWGNEAPLAEAAE